MSVPSSALPLPAQSRASLAIVTVLFFMWGLLTTLNDVLVPHLNALYTLSYLQAMLVQFCFLSACFLVSLPAGRLIQRLGYERGAVAGLVVAAVGCLLFLPAVSAGYAHFLDEAAQGSGLLCMAIVGGALLPLLQGHMADVIGLQASFGVPALCYAGIAAFGWRYGGLFGS